jgi:hypothetical protein
MRRKAPSLVTGSQVNLTIRQILLRMHFWCQAESPGVPGNVASDDPEPEQIGNLLGA